MDDIAEREGAKKNTTATTATTATTTMEEDDAIHLQRIQETSVTEEETTDPNGTKHRIRSLSFTPDHHLGHFGDHDEARDIHDKFHIHEEGLKNKTDRLQKKAKRKTQLRLQARRQFST